MTKVAMEFADDVLEQIVAKSLTENRSVDNWLDTFLRRHFYGEVAALTEAQQNWMPDYERTARDVGARKRAQVYRRSQGRCHYCAAQIDPFDWECDHVVPLASGGTNDITNLVAACPACNGSKGAKSVVDFAKARA